jgi:hypothetical protein
MKCIDRILVAGTLIWKISDYTSKLNEAKTKEGMELVSPPFYTSQYGYKLQVQQTKSSSTTLWNEFY